MILDDREIDIFVASRIGSFKHIKYHTDSSKNNKKCIENLIEIKSLQKDDGVCCMEWADEEETEILMGKNNNQIQLYNTQKHDFTKTYPTDFGSGHLVGLARSGRQHIAAKSNGTVRVWTKKTETLVETGGKLDTMRMCPMDNTMFATGGEENDLKVFTLATSVPVFSAKNVANDWLQLRVPVWVTDVAWLTGHVIAAASRHGYVRLFDTRAQRRPVKNVTFEKMAATCIAPAFDEHHVLVGFGRGQLHQVDMRHGRLDKGYKGAVGALSSVCSIPGDSPLVASAGLDRSLRVHHADTKELLYKQYLTSKLSCLLVQTKSSTPLKNSPSEDIKEESGVKQEEVVTVDEMDELFDNMETVGIKEPPKKRICPSSEGTTSVELSAEDAIAQLLRNTEKQKRKREKIRREKKKKSVFYDAK